MPELIEVEQYRRAADALVDHEILSVEVHDPSYLRGGSSAANLEDALVGSVVVGTDRLGKVLLVDLDRGHRVGLRFGMTGRLLVNGHSPIERLEYGPAGSRPEWIRFALRTGRGAELSIVDPRRLGSVELDPDLSRIGPDAASIDRRSFRAALGRSEAPIKARLLDQSRIGGIGNLIADETLWQVGIDPARPAASLSDAEVRRLHTGLRSSIRRLTRRGGSHTGDLQTFRQRGASCPRCGATLVRRTIGGRTTYSCPQEQH